MSNVAQLLGLLASDPNAVAPADVTPSLLAAIIHYLNGNSDVGSGIVKLVPAAAHALGLSDSHQIPAFVVSAVAGLQQSQFGGYPDHKDVAPSGVFTAVFIVLMFAHIIVFLKDRARGHTFFLTLFFALFCLCQWFGYALRIVWAKDLLKLNTGLASEVFLILSTILIGPFNLVLAYRLFKRKHPALGSTKLLKFVLYFSYFMVVPIVLMAVISGVSPYRYYMSTKHYVMCRNVMKVASVFIVLPSLYALILVAGALLLPSSAKDSATVTFTPSWLSSYAPWFFPAKGAAADTAAAFASEHTGVSPVRVSGPSGFFLSTLVVLVTSIIFFLGAIFRAVGTFKNSEVADQIWLFKPVVMYIIWGTLGAIANIIYLVFRVDLRFYQPDPIKSAASSIITSDNETSNKSEKETV